MVKRLGFMEKKLTNRGPPRERADKHSIYTIKKKQMVVEAGDERPTADEEFYALAAASPLRRAAAPSAPPEKICDKTCRSPLTLFHYWVPAGHFEEEARHAFETPGAELAALFQPLDKRMPTTMRTPSSRPYRAGTRRLLSPVQRWGTQHVHAFPMPADDLQRLTRAGALAALPGWCAAAAPLDNLEGEAIMAPTTTTHTIQLHRVSCAAGSGFHPARSSMRTRWSNGCRRVASRARCTIWGSPSKVLMFCSNFAPP